MAIGRSKADPSFLISAGADIDGDPVTGNSKPEFLIARFYPIFAFPDGPFGQAYRGKGRQTPGMSTST